jgi:hypothetical protein
MVLLIKISHKKVNIEAVTPLGGDCRGGNYLRGSGDISPLEIMHLTIVSSVELCALHSLSAAAVFFSFGVSADAGDIAVIAVIAMITDIAATADAFISLFLLCLWFWVHGSH